MPFYILPAIKREYGKNGYHTYKYRVMVKENGKNKYYGFKPPLSSALGGRLNASNRRLGMPETKNSRYCLADKQCYVREFIVSADSPVYLGTGTKHWCDDSWFFPDCYDMTYDDILVPKAGNY